MNTIEFIKTSIATSRGMTLNLINDLKNEPLAQPTVNGGNHALWILGHITYSESSLLHCMIQGKESCPLNHLKEHFDFKCTPSTDASIYPSFDSLIADYETAHNETMAYLDTLTNDDLNKPALGCPDEYKDFFGTVAQCFMIMSLHPSMHYGQLADTRRALGREPMMA